MEVYSGAHYWTRLFRQYGHEPRLMVAKFVSPYRMAGKSGKNDANNAQAICEAVRRPHMRFVTVKDENQQAMQCLHRTRQGFIEEKTATYNRLRGLISEFSVIAPQSTDALLSRRVFCHFRFNNTFMTCWYTLIVLKIILLNMTGFVPHGKSRSPQSATNGTERD